MDDTTIALDTIRDTLASVRPRLQSAFGNIATNYKADNSPVTELDIYVEQQLKAALRELDPTIGFYGEETEHESLGERTWLIDPIDGTDYFVRGLPLCANLVALLEHGTVTMGVVYNFMTDEFFHAFRGAGAFLNGSPLQVTERAPDKSLLIYESSADAADNFQVLRNLYAAIPPANVFHQYISGYQLAQVACGKYDGIICRLPYEHIWDVAAGTLLVEEAGGKVTNLQSDAYDVTNLDFVASTSSLFTSLRDKGVV